MAAARLTATERPPRPRVSAAAETKQTKAQKALSSLNAAMESHDIEMLKKAIPQAAAAGVAFKEIDGAQRLLDFEVNKELFADLIGVRESVEALAKTVEKVEKQVKTVSGGVAIDHTIPAEAWLTTIVQQVEAQIWDSLEKRVEEKVRDAVASATAEIKKSARDLSDLLNTAVSKESEKAGGKNLKSPSLGLDSGDDSSGSETGEGKGKGKGKSKGKNNDDSQHQSNRSSVLVPDGLGSNTLGLAHSGSSLQDRRPSSGLLSNRAGAVPQKKEPEPVVVAAPPAKKRKPVEVTGIRWLFMNSEDNIRSVLNGEALHGDQELDEGDMRRNVPQFLEEPQNWGLRVKDVKKFYDTIKDDMKAYVKKEQDAGEDFKENLHVVTPRFIKPWTKMFSPYSLAGVINADNLCNRKVNTLEEIMTARIFISHCWNEEFSDFIGTMVSVLEPDDTVWICALSICQNVDINSILGERIEDSPFWRAMPYCRRVTMLIDRNAEPFERAWCALEEYLATYKLRLPFSICMPDTMDEEAWNEVDRKLQNFSIRECKASEESDKQKIMDIIGDKADIIDRVVRDESQKACFAARVMKVATSGTIGELTPLAMHALVQVADGAGRTILHICAQMGKAAMMKDLLEHELHLDCRDQAGKAPLHFSAEIGEEIVTSLLIKKEADVNLRDNQKCTPLSSAANKGQVTIVSVLVSAGAEIDATDFEGFTPLLSAAVEGFHEVASELIRLKADMDRKDSYGHSALTLASQANYDQVVNVLIEAGMNLDSTDVDGCTPLMYAAGFGFTKVVKSLLNGRANTGMRDLQQYTPLDFATDEGHQEIIELLTAKKEHHALPAMKGHRSQS